MTDQPLLLLGLVPGASEAPDAAPVHLRVACGNGLDAIMTTTTAVPETEPEVEALRLAMLQASILSAYAVAGDVLPVALGAAFSDRNALVAHLRILSPQVEAERTALCGSAEYVVAIDKREPVPLPAGLPEESSYLRRRQAERNARRSLDHDRQALVSRVLSALRLADARLAPPRKPGHASLVTVSALLRRTAAADVATALDALGPEASRLALGLRMIGPCAPFSFVSPARNDA